MSRRSFYQYLMTNRNPHSKSKTSLEIFAESVYEDIAFPIHATAYEEITSYLELEGYVPDMGIFDEAWEEYKERY